MKSKTRRSFLRAVGAGFAALPFMRLLEDSVAQAQGEVTVIAVFAVMSLLAVPVALSLEEVQQSDGPKTG